MAKQLQADLPIVKLVDLVLGSELAGENGDLDKATIFLVLEHVEFVLDKELKAREWTEE